MHSRGRKLEPAARLNEQRGQRVCAAAGAQAWRARAVQSQLQQLARRCRPYAGDPCAVTVLSLQLIALTTASVGAPPHPPGSLTQCLENELPRYVE